jgi:type I restriction enzyme S subunit
MKEEKFLKMAVPLPSLEEQVRIVRRLDMVAALVAERRRAIEAAERATQALLLKAFQRAADGAPLRPMSEVAPLVRRPVEIDLDGTYPELGVRSFGRGTFHKPDLIGAELSWQKPFLVQEGDLVFSNIKAWEGAFAVAGPDDHGRVGSHRYLTCVPVDGLATAEFIWFYLQTHEGISKVQAASPGSADRNRTLGQSALEAITVPTPPVNRQHWFNSIQTMAREACAIRANTSKDVEALVPAMLHEIFNGKAAAA